MNHQLPAAIMTFFSVGNGSTTDAPSSYFTDDAKVYGEEHHYQGHAAIQEWRAEARRKYTYRAEPNAVTEEADGIHVRATVTGNFPGSLAQIEYRFQLTGEKIKTVEIR